MTKEEFADLKKGQTIVVIVRMGKKTMRKPCTIKGKMRDIYGVKKLFVSAYGFIDETDVDFLRKSDVCKMMDEETKRHIKAMDKLNELLKEAK